MSMEEIIRSKLQHVYQADRRPIMSRIAGLLEPELDRIVQTFYSELLSVPEIAPILENAIVEKNLRGSLQTWTRLLFEPHDDARVVETIGRQREIGSVHANINVNLNFFAHGISILKREIYRLIRSEASSNEETLEAFLVTEELFDSLVPLISEAYFSNEIVHETNELSLKIKGMTPNAAVEYERLRSMLLDWYRETVTLLYTGDPTDVGTLPKVRDSNFGLWVVYKADLLCHDAGIAAELRRHITRIDKLLMVAARSRSGNDPKNLSRTVNDLNEAVTQASWFISSVVDQAMELDTGTDPLTRLFNRRFLETILRRQTQISLKQGLPFSLLMIDLDHFKDLNDAHGHEAGDTVLKEFAELLLHSVRSSDFVFRYGGEEFLIVLGNVELSQALLVAEKIREKCGDAIFRPTPAGGLRMTCSIGIAAFDGHPDYSRLVGEADSALYKAKAAGRNRVVAAA